MSPVNGGDAGKGQLTGDGMTGRYIETDSGLWWLPDDVCEQLRTWKVDGRLFGLPVVWQDERQEPERVLVGNRAERRRKKRGKR
jgi:hypothetical protein